MLRKRLKESSVISAEFESCDFASRLRDDPRPGRAHMSSMAREGPAIFALGRRKDKRKALEL